VNAVIAMGVGEVRRIPGQSVKHTPQQENRAHSDVFGEKDEEARVQLNRIATMVLPLPPI
jgi:hypothetical protein